MTLERNFYRYCAIIMKLKILYIFNILGFLTLFHGTKFNICVRLNVIYSGKYDTYASEDT